MTETHRAVLPRDDPFWSETRASTRARAEGTSPRPQHKQSRDPPANQVAPVASSSPGCLRLRGNGGRLAGPPIPVACLPLGGAWTAGWAPANTSPGIEAAVVARPVCASSTTVVGKTRPSAAHWTSISLVAGPYLSPFGSTTMYRVTYLECTWIGIIRFKR
jgi:hypothetical protein